jgi:hypothetical protein
MGRYFVPESHSIYGKHYAVSFSSKQTLSSRLHLVYSRKHSITSSKLYSHCLVKPSVTYIVRIKHFAFIFLVLIEDQKSVATL